MALERAWQPLCLRYDCATRLTLKARTERKSIAAANGAKPGFWTTPRLAIRLARSLVKRMLHLWNK